MLRLGRSGTGDAGTVLVQRNRHQLHASNEHLLHRYHPFSLIFSRLVTHWRILPCFFSLFLSYTWKNSEASDVPVRENTDLSCRHPY